ncbi:DJ-1/PfpI family protein [Methylophaga sulfidovorans]|uniref:Cyclohexyl-isocyanide hydratase n=1 Tax=Methylophaga sulfidovorans TaxID=45496 RepID=A0A1I4ADJ9_9GAMM|nr:DJ-1/PfpI family protein [Methylophaga sulfidovorans]SFK53856.1 cyclohexyl-isocyanide hydratase [Methylophaga sulfidovorans]
MKRRKFMQLTGLSSLLAVMGKSPIASASTSEKASTKHLSSHAEVMAKYSDLSSGPKLTIVMLVYPGMFLQDLVGPLTVFESLLNRDIHLVWKDTNPLDNINNSPIPITPTTSFNDCPKECDVLFVPGGVPGTFDVMEDQEVLTFLKRQASSAKYVTSVCTGSLILGAAGLLTGYKATSNWLTLEALSKFESIPVKKRVVVDRNRITGAGVTAGIDFALVIAEKLRNKFCAESIQLYLEYDPQPPFNAGSPDTAPKEVVTFLETMFVSVKDIVNTIAKRTYKRL